MKIKNVNDQGLTDSTPINTTLTPEIFSLIAENLHLHSLLKSRLICKRFNEMFQSYEDGFIDRSLEYIQKINTPGEYRNYISYFQTEYNNHKINDKAFKKIKNYTNSARSDLVEKITEQEHFTIKIWANIIMGLSCFIVPSAAYLVLNQGDDNEKWQKCWLKESHEVDELGCQEQMDHRLLLYFITKTVLGSGIGFALKMLDNYFLFFQNKFLMHDNHILPELPLERPLTVLNKVNYLLWHALGYRDIPVFATGVALSAYIKLSNSLHVDIHACMPEAIDDIGKVIDNTCLTKNSDNVLNDLSGISISQGVMYGFSIIGILFLFYKLLEKMCKGVKNTYQTSNLHRFFTSPNSFQRIPNMEPKEGFENAYVPRPFTL